MPVHQGGMGPSPPLDAQFFDLILQSSCSCDAERLLVGVEEGTLPPPIQRLVSPPAPGVLGTAGSDSRAIEKQATKHTKNAVARMIDAREMAMISFPKKLLAVR